MIEEFHRLADFLEAERAIVSSGAYRADPAAQSAFLRRCRAYDLIAHRCQGRRALDLGCSLGHGARLLAGSSSAVVAVDSGARVLRAAARIRPSGNVRYVRADAFRLPFPDGAFEVVAAFHLIEHLPPPRVASFLKEARRVAAAGGEVIVATPNRSFRLLPGQRPFNPEHRQEFTRRSLVRSLREVFEEVSVLGIRGGDRLDALERARLRRSPLRIYLRDPLASLVKCLVPGLRLRKRRLPTRESGAWARGGGTGTRLDDYWADARHPERGIDLLAVCRRG